MITRQPINERISILQDVTFTCEAKGFGVEYEWKRYSGSVTGGGQSSLTISEATPLDEDQYYCVAMTEGGYAFSNNVTLTVDGKNFSVNVVISQHRNSKKGRYKRWIWRPRTKGPMQKPSVFFNLIFHCPKN